MLIITCIKNPAFLALLMCIPNYPSKIRTLQVVRRLDRNTRNKGFNRMVLKGAVTMKILINASIITSILVMLLLVIIRETSILDKKIMKLQGIETNKIELVNQNPLAASLLSPEQR